MRTFRLKNCVAFLYCSYGKKFQIFFVFSDSFLLVVKCLGNAFAVQSSPPTNLNEKYTDFSGLYSTNELIKSKQGFLCRKSALQMNKD